MEGKLVRDNIPEIIRQSGEQPVFHTLQSETEYKRALLEKLVEEAKELLASPNVDERADIEEVLRAIDELFGFDPAEIEAVRRDKADERGAFRRRIYLEGVREE